MARWFFLFVSTLLLGGLSVVLVELAFNLHGITRIDTTLVDILVSMVWFFAMGMTFGTISQMALFSYLMLHRLGLGLFKSHRLWNRAQVVLIAFTFFDLVYFRYVFYAQAGETWLDFMILPTLLLLGSLPVAYIKAKETKSGVFIPTLFFMFVITTIASIPALVLGQNDTDWIILMVVSIFLCHTWQILMLHRLNKPANS